MTINRLDCILLYLKFPLLSDKMPYTSIQEYRCHFLDEGQIDPPIILIHSTGTGSWQWNKYLELLKPRRMIIPDLLGYAPTDPWKENSVPSHQVDYELVEKILLQQNNPVSLIGHSYGGFLALQLAKKHPKRITSLLLHEPVTWGVLQHSDKYHLQHSFCHLLDKLFSRGPSINPETWLELFIDYWNGSETWKQLPYKTKQLWITKFPKVYDEVHHLCHDKTPLRYWQKLTQPITITCGHQSPIHIKEVCDILASALSNTTLYKHHGGHLSPLLQFEKLEVFISNWAQRNK
jgi:pimeloyl-ACP methyl ester carboxylesterase